MAKGQEIRVLEAHQEVPHTLLPSLNLPNTTTGVDTQSIQKSHNFCWVTKYNKQSVTEKDTKQDQFKSLNNPCVQLLWCLSDPCVQLLWCLSDPCVQLLWCLSGPCVQLLWCLSGPFVQLLWCLSGPCVQLLWCLSDPCVQLLWCLSDPCVQLLWCLSGPCVQLLWCLLYLSFIFLAFFIIFRFFSSSSLRMSSKSSFIPSRALKTKTTLLFY